MAKWFVPMLYEPLVELHGALLLCFMVFLLKKGTFSAQHEGMVIPLTHTVLGPFGPSVQFFGPPCPVLFRPSESKADKIFLSKSFQQMLLKGMGEV